jgi:hypothetical protein
MGKSHVGKVSLSGRVLAHEGKQYDVAGAYASVETDGAVVERFTATRIVLLGVFALAFKKKKDKRGLYLLVDGPGYAFVAELDPKKDSLAARRMAQEITLAGTTYAPFAGSTGAARVVLVNPLHIEGYMVEVDWDGQTLRAHPTNKMSQVALNAGRRDDVVLAAEDIASIGFQPATPMTNGSLTIGASNGKSYQLHFRRKSSDDFARLRDSLLDVGPPSDLAAPATPQNPSGDKVPLTPPAAPPAPAERAAPPGWHTDPHGEARLRYWDGATWTGHTAE